MQARYIGKAGVPTLTANLKIDGDSIHLLGTHTLPPVDIEYVTHRNHQAAALADYVAAQKSHVALLGDLNMTSWSPVFQDLIGQSGLRDTRRGFGVQPTWPPQIPYLLIPIDHALVSPNIEVLDRRTGPNLGSDHRAVILDISLHSEHAP